VQENRKIYNAADLAKMYGIHPNTIRLYERLGFISQAQRNTNNYRMFEELHAWQIKVCRCIFGYPYTNRRIRNAGYEIIGAMAKKQWDSALQYTDNYIKIIDREITMAQNAAEVLRRWAYQTKDKDIVVEERKLSRKEAASCLGVTVEAVRNWERNDLIISNGVGEKGETLYSGVDLERMCVISMLLQSGYSISSIHRSISMYDKGDTELAASALNNPECDDLISAGDRWLYELTKLMRAAKEIPQIMEEMKKK
jgi:DNA-binding transcriptional MerR regulator